MNHTAAVVLLGIVAVVIPAAVVVALRWWTWRPVVAQRVMVQTDADVSFEGVIVSRRGPLLVLDDVTVWIGQAANKADGQVVVDRARVTWMQVR